MTVQRACVQCERAFNVLCVLANFSGPCVLTAISKLTALLVTVKRGSTVYVKHADNFPHIFICIHV